MIKINYALGLSFFVACVLLISCSDKQKKAINESQIKDIEVVGQVNFVGQWMGEGKREYIVRDFVREYEFLNQDIDINLKFPEEIGFNRYNSDETLNFIGGALQETIPQWDVMYINDEMEGISKHLNDPDWTHKYLVDFSQYPELLNNTISEIDLNKVKERWNGIIPGPFLEGQYWALWTNKKVTDKLGIEVKQYGMSFTDFLSYIKAVNSYNENNSDKILAFQEASDWTTLFSIVFNLFVSEVGSVEEIYNDKITEKKLKAWHKTLKACEQLSAYKFLDDSWRGNIWSEINHSLVNEECLFFSNGSWMYNIWSESNPEEVTNCVPNEYPSFGKLPIYPSTYPIMWGVHKNSPNKEEAIKFLLKMSQPSMAEKWVRNTKSPTGIKGNLADISFGADQFENFSYHVQKTYGANTYKMNENSSLIFDNDHIYEPSYFLNVVSGEMTADEAMVKIRESLGASAVE